MDTFIHYGLAASIQAVQRRRAADQRCARPKRRRAHRLPGRLGHRRPAADRGHARRADEARPAPHLAVLRAGVDHQHDLGPRVDHVRLPGPEPGDRHRLHDRPALHRRGRPADRVRRRRRDDRRRRRGDHLAARRRRLRRGARAVDAQRRSRRPRRARGTRTATASCSAKAPACWCSRSTSTRRRAARRSTPSWSASAWAPTRIHMTAPNVDGPKRAMHGRAAQCAASTPDQVAVPQRARHLDAARRRQRDQRDQARLRRPRARSWSSTRPSR